MITAPPFHCRYLELVARIERDFPVAQWVSGDLEIWPLARMDLYLDMYWANGDMELPKSRPRIWRALSAASIPVRNLWKSRRDLRHWIAHPKPADTIFLGDGVSLDLVDGAWHDRFCEPVIAALERRGSSAFLMQSGDLARLPWHRPTYPANLVALRGNLLARIRSDAVVELPEHERVLAFLSENKVRAPSLSRSNLERRAHAVAATASAFESVLRRVKPKLAFVVTYYAGLGPAFMLACRRQRVMSIDLQHCPQEGAHKAYSWRGLPEKGYATLPAVFWNWTERDATDIQSWAGALALPWHRSLHGGHTQLFSYLNDADPATRTGDATFAAISGGESFEREILVALQPVGGFKARWEALAGQIESSPSGWRWWIRRHPASAPHQDAEFDRLISLRRHNVVVDGSSSMPLPVILRHMNVIVSRFSGAAAEAAILGVPAIFLSEEAHGQYSGLIDGGFARIVGVESLLASIAALPVKILRPAQAHWPALEQTLDRLGEMSREYSRLFL
jgi:hypothetical protein